MDIIEKAIQILRPRGKRGTAGIWMDEHQIVKAAHAVRQGGFKKVEAISPFPIHGIDEALGLPLSYIPWVTFVFGLAGCLFGLWFTCWTSAVSWPVPVGGKPFLAIPAFIPIMFELTILFGSLSSVGALFIICGLPQVDPPVLDPALTSHKFALFIPEGSAGYDASKIEQIFRDHGAVEVKRAEF